MEPQITRSRSWTSDSGGRRKETRSGLGTNRQRQGLGGYGLSDFTARSLIGMGCWPDRLVAAPMRRRHGPGFGRASAVRCTVEALLQRMAGAAGRKDQGTSERCQGRKAAAHQEFHRCESGEANSRARRLPASVKIGKLGLRQTFGTTAPAGSGQTPRLHQLSKSAVWDPELCPHPNTA